MATQPELVRKPDREGTLTTERICHMCNRTIERVRLVDGRYVCAPCVNEGRILPKAS